MSDDTTTESHQNRPAVVGPVQRSVRQHAETLRDLLACCNAWEPEVRIRGNVKAGDAAQSVAWMLNQNSALTQALIVMRGYPDFDDGIGPLPKMMDDVLAGAGSEVLEFLGAVRELWPAA
jgi:hypothetical protein